MSHEVMKMTSTRFKEGKYNKAILALGSCECHGPHLAHGTDTLVSYMLSCKVAEQIPGLLVLPPVTIGCSEHYAAFPFTLSVSFATMVSVIRDILHTTYQNGIKRIFIFNGHDGNMAPAEIASRQVKIDYPDIRIAYLSEWWMKAGELLPKGTFEVWNGLGHAGEGESSIAYYLFEDWCQPELAKGVIPDHLPKDVSLQWLFAEITDTGSTGDPTKATREKGKLMAEALIQMTVDTLKELDAMDWKYHSTHSTIK